MDNQAGGGGSSSSCAIVAPCVWPRWSWFKAFMAEFGAAFLFGFMLDVARAVQINAGGKPFTAFEVGFGYSALYLIMGFTYLLFLGGVPHLSPSNTLIDLLCDHERQGTPWSYYVKAFFITVGSFTGRLVGQASATVIYPWDLSLTLPVPNPDISWGAHMFITMLVLALWGGALVFVDRKVYSPWLVVAASAALGLGTSLYISITGGSFSIYQTLSSAIVFGDIGDTNWSAELVALFLAAIAVAILRMVVFGVDMSNR